MTLLKFASSQKYLQVIGNILLLKKADELFMQPVPKYEYNNIKYYITLYNDKNMDKRI